MQTEGDMGVLAAVGQPDARLETGPRVHQNHLTGRMRIL